jgi:hypothetical protein
MMTAVENRSTSPEHGATRRYVIRSAYSAGAVAILAYILILFLVATPAARREGAA